MNHTEKFNIIFGKQEKHFMKSLENYLLPLLLTIALLGIIYSNEIVMRVHFPNLDKIIWGVSAGIFYAVFFRYKRMVQGAWSDFYEKDAVTHYELSVKVNDIVHRVTEDSEIISELQTILTDMIEVKDSKRKYKRQLDDVMIKYLSIFDEPVRCWVSNSLTKFHAFVNDVHQRGVSDTQADVFQAQAMSVDKEIMEDGERNLPLSLFEAYTERNQVLFADFIEATHTIITDRFNSKHERMQEECIMFEEKRLKMIINILITTKEK